MAKRCFAFQKFMFIVTAFIAGTIPSAASENSPLNGQVHGFFSQVAVVSDGNNIAGDSSGGSYRFNEIGINGSLQYGNILFAGQVVSVRNALSGSSRPEIDYAVADIPLVSASSDVAGIRLGRPKLPFGLYGSVRDVASARPGIFMPDGIYYTSGGARELLFSRNGAQLYWDHFTDNSNVSLAVNWMAKENMRETLEHIAFGQSFDGHFELDSGYAGQLQYTHFDSGLTANLTWIDAEAEFSAFPLMIEFSQATGSLQLAKESWIFTTELMRRELASSQNRGGIRVAAYLEAKRLFAGGWESFVRYEELWREIGDRSGKEYAAKEGVPAHAGYAFDSAIGVKRTFSNDISLAAEAHYIDGSGTIDRLSNLAAVSGPPTGTGDSSLLASSSSYFAVQLAYQF